MSRGFEAGLPQPSDAVLLSPWLHLGLRDPAVGAIAKIDPILNLDFCRKAARYYWGVIRWIIRCSTPATGPLTGLPKVTVLTGAHDVFNPDARAFRPRAEAEGIEIGWYELDGGTHGWMCLPFGRDAREASEYIGKIPR